MSRRAFTDAVVAGVLASTIVAAGQIHHGGARTVAAGGQTRTYYIAADEVVWNYAPRHRNRITGRRFGPDERVFVGRGRGRIGSRYVKAVYRRYTDDTFRTRVRRTGDEVPNGLLGPTIRAEVGDTLRVVFLNRTRFRQSMHPHGVFYDKGSEGAPYADGTPRSERHDDAVPRGRRHTYVWQVPERAGPGSGDPSSVMWMYHSHTNEVADTNAGLIGPLIVTRQGMARPDGSPNDVDHELVALFSVIDENASPYLELNARRFLGRSRRGTPDRSPEEAIPHDEGFEESNLMHTINGYVYGNGPPFTVAAGDRVRWHTMSLGTEVDLHSPHWHGNVITTSMGMRGDVVSLLPGQMATADMRPDDRGTWLFHCHVNDHILAGMQSLYVVR